MRCPGLSSCACSTSVYSASGTCHVAAPRSAIVRASEEASRAPGAVSGSRSTEPVRRARRREADPRFVRIVLAEVPHAPGVGRVAAVADQACERLLAARLRAPRRSVLPRRPRTSPPGEIPAARGAPVSQSRAPARAPRRGPSADRWRRAETPPRTGSAPRRSRAPPGARTKSRRAASASWVTVYAPGRPGVCVQPAAAASATASRAGRPWPAVRRVSNRPCIISRTYLNRPADALAGRDAGRVGGGSAWRECVVGGECCGSELRQRCGFRR